MNVSNDVYIFRNLVTLPSRTFVRLLTLPYKMQSKASEWVGEVQSVLCEDAGLLERVIVV